MGTAPASATGGGWTVRTRIVVVITVVAAIGLMSVGAAVYLVERTRILAAVDTRLEAALESARALVAAGNGETAWASSTSALEATVTRISPDDNTGALGVIDGVAAFIPGVPLDVDLQSAPGFVPYVTAVAQGDPVIGTYAEEGVAWRYLAAPIAVEGSAPPSPVMFVTAYDLEGELAEIDDAARVYLVAAGIALVVIAASAGLVAARLLQPLRRMRETAARVSARSLAERLPVEGNDDVSALAATMNDMLDRLDSALGAQRTLLSDVGHELKTPVTIVSGHLDVMDASDPADVRSTRELVLDELGRMGRLIQDLTQEAALRGPSPLHPQTTDMTALVEQVVVKVRGIEGASVRRGPVAPIHAVVDRARITQALLQLAQNGVSHGGGDLVLGVRSRGETMELFVRDHGPGVPADERERIFERFHRGAADDGRGGSGLGLNIVAAIAHNHGGAATVRDPTTGPGAEFVLTIPIVADIPADSVPPRPPLPRGIPAHDRPEG
ncbi:sensor histidine kinase [Microbacterium proteolyticum]|uniref:sensor histidine kinase n=1 Tax=Microbacterium proteolyticum TaxID=1572644 RepID=UPI001FACD0FD|nr:HAMP domain-containing sensor histidine kinase [Microbacterium proteolyticum]MCI9859576.1 HAMP domain-containing histidine kinase [Microbacterium proteolyticum]